MRRLASLDSLRGLAALSVMGAHSWPGVTVIPPGIAAWPPFNLLWVGRPAVMLFFVLSGFVLSLPWHDGRPPTWWAFLIRRFFRLWPLYALVIVVSALWAIPLQGRLFGLYPSPLSAPAAVLENYLPLLKSWNANLVDAPIWSLIYEARISLVFPLLMLVMSRYKRPWIPLTLSIELAIVSHWLPAPLDTLEYLPAFVGGSYLARYRVALSAWYQALRPSWRIGAGIVAVSLFGLADPLHADALAMAVSGWLILVALSEPSAQPVLAWRPLAAIGAASYSLYLVHALALAPAWLILGDRVSWVVVLVPCWLVAILGALALYRWLEKPSIALGRFLVVRDEPDHVHRHVDVAAGLQHHGSV